METFSEHIPYIFLKSHYQIYTMKILTPMEENNMNLGVMSSFPFVFCIRKRKSLRNIVSCHHILFFISFYFLRYFAFLNNSKYARHYNKEIFYLIF